MNSPLETLNLTSISGVVAATLLTVEVLKRAIGRYNFFSKVPVFVYAMVIAALYAVFANKIIIIDGHPALEGNIWKVIWAAVIAAGSSSGFYTWLRNPETMQTANRLSVLALGMILLGGCFANPDKVAIREGMYQGTSTIRQQHKDWASKLVRQPDGTDKRAELPQLTEADYKQVQKTHEEFEELVNKDRQRDTTK